MFKSNSTANTTLSPISTSSKLETSTSTSALPIIRPSSKGLTSTGIQIFEGSKLFWRQRLNVDLNILYHEHKNFFEVCLYDRDKSQELPRLLLDAKVLLWVTEPEINNKITEKLNILIAKEKGKKGLSLPPEQQLSIKNEIIAKYIMDRLQPNIDKSVDPPLTTFSMIPLSGDTIDFDTLEYKISSEKAVDVDQSGVQKTDELPTTNIRRRRKQTMADFNTSMESFRSDSMHLNEMCSRAQKLTALSEMAVSSFAALMRSTASSTSGKSRMKLSDCDKSTPLGKFKWACVRIMLLNALAAVNKRLVVSEEKAKNQKIANRMVGTFPPFEAGNSNEMSRVLSPSKSTRESKSMIVPSTSRQSSIKDFNKLGVDTTIEEEKESLLPLTLSPQPVATPTKEVSRGKRNESPKSVTAAASHSTKLPSIDHSNSNIGKSAETSASLSSKSNASHSTKKSVKAK